MNKEITEIITAISEATKMTETETGNTLIKKTDIPDEINELRSKRGLYPLTYFFMNSIDPSTENLAFMSCLK